MFKKEVQNERWSSHKLLLHLALKLSRKISSGTKIIIETIRLILQSVIYSPNTEEFIYLECFSANVH